MAKPRKRTIETEGSNRKEGRAATIASTADDKAESSFRSRMQVKLLQAAERIIADEGLAEAQARRIASEAGCAIGTIYNVFGGLDGLITKVNSETLDLFGRAALTAVQRKEPDDIEGRLLALALAYFDFAVTHNLRWRALFDHIPSHAASGDPDIRKRQGALFALVETAVASSLVDPVDRTRAARALFASTHGIVVLSVGTRVDPAQLPETERQLRFVVSLFARALSPGTKPPRK